MKPDCHAFIIRLIATRDGKLPATAGHLAHAAFLDLLHQADPALSSVVHDYNGPKPFTLSSLEGYGPAHNGFLPVRAGQEGWLRVTLLDPVLFQPFVYHFLQGGGRTTIRLHQHAFQVTEILGRSDSHPLAGSTSWQGLVERWQSADLSDEAHHTIQLHFRTPTAFSIRNGSHRQVHLLPDSALVFGQLAARWDRLTGADSADTIRAAALHHILITRHRLETHALQFKKAPQIGFTGLVAWKIVNTLPPETIRHLNLLADLAFYTGIGSKTTQGMGQVNRAGLT